MPRLRLLLMLSAILGLAPFLASADMITISGTVTHNGSYDGDTLYVAVLVTALTDEVQLYPIRAYAVGNSPISQAYSFDLDDAMAPPVNWVAALLDVDGDGVETIGPADLVAWNPGAATPTP